MPDFTWLPARSSIVTQKEAHLCPVLSPSLEHIQHSLPVTDSSLCRWITQKHISSQVWRKRHPQSQYWKSLLYEAWQGHKTCDNNNVGRVCMWCLPCESCLTISFHQHHLHLVVLSEQWPQRKQLWCVVDYLYWCRAKELISYSFSSTCLRPFHHTNGLTHYSQVEVNEADLL